MKNTTETNGNQTQREQTMYTAIMIGDRVIVTGREELGTGTVERVCVNDRTRRVFVMIDFSWITPRTHGFNANKLSVVRTNDGRI